MKKSLLICISAHYDPERRKYLERILFVFLNDYKCSKDIIIDTNTHDLDYLNEEGIEVCVHKELRHPFYLTWVHRKHMKDNIEKYSNFMYIEGDIELPYENYCNYLENFKILYPNFIPSFIRIEEANGNEYITDATERQKLKIIEIDGKQFITLKNPYHGFWIMPKKQLEESIDSNFVRLHESREHAASYPMWGLNKIPLVEIENNLVSKLCYSYHLPNNYALSKESQFGKIKPENIFI